MTETTIRTFIAAPVPEETRRRLYEAAEPLRRALPELRWTQPAGWHLTLHFLGSVPEGAVCSLTRILEQAAATEAPFEVHFTRFGSFPENGPARVIWAGPGEPVAPLVRLHTALGKPLERQGFRVERRPFHAHLTLARVKEPAAGRPVAGVLQKHAWQPIEPFAVDRIVLYRSQLRPSGAVYSEINSAALAAGGE